MNTMIKMLAAAAALVAGSAQAEVYVQGSAGTSNWSLSCDADFSCDKSGRYIRLLGGYAFSNGVAIELGYTDFGKSQAKATAAALAGTGLTYADGTFKASGPFAGVAYHLPVATAWGMVFRAGLGAMKTTANSRSDVLTIDLADTTTQPYLGMGVNYAFTKSIKLELGLDLSRAKLEGETENLRAISLGLRAHF